MRRLKVWLCVLKHFFLSINCNKKAILLNSEQTVQIAKEKSLSIIRLGDGEFNILNEKSIRYQKFSPELKKQLYDIIETYIKHGGECKYLLCMPNEFLRCNGLKLMYKRAWVSSWAFTRYFFKKFFDVNITYGDAFLFAKGNESIYSTLWSNYENIIFVHNSVTYSDKFSKLYCKKSYFVKVPTENAYAEIEGIYNEILKYANNLQNFIVLISAGPCAKILVKKLSERGIIAIDTGHCWDFPLSLRR